MNIRRKACMLTLLTFSNNPDCVNYNLENRNKVIIFFYRYYYFTVIILQMELIRRHKR